MRKNSWHHVSKLITWYFNKLPWCCWHILGEWGYYSELVDKHVYMYSENGYYILNVFLNLNCCIYIHTLNITLNFSILFEIKCLFLKSCYLCCKLSDDIIYTVAVSVLVQTDILLTPKTNYVKNISHIFSN